MKSGSLTRHLLAWALGALVLVWVSFMLVGFRTGVHEADELTDGHLASVASLLLSERNGEFVQRPDVGSAVAPDLKRHDYQQSMSVVVWDAAGRPITQSGDAPVPRFDVNEGFADLQLGDPPTSWRAFSQWDGPGHARKVTVMLSVKERDELAWDIAEQVIEPGLWLLPVVALALGIAIRRGLMPLYELSNDVHALDVHRPSPLKPRHPQAEFEAVVDAINELVQRHQSALRSERQLASEMAHELRTPLTALALQARALRGTLTVAERDASLERLELDALRAGAVLSQLLALARASHTELAEAAQPLDLAALAARVLAGCAESAAGSGHELALVAPSTMPLSGHPVLLEMALRNLIDNAIGHTPSGTLVEVQLDGTQRWLQVCDNGAPVVGADVKPGAAASAAVNAESTTGIEPATHPAISLGLGLGHRVVEKIAAIHQASFGTHPAPPGFSTCYRITFHASAGQVGGSTPGPPSQPVS
jgi:two-component system, OmpR family, sensor histidine kinase QseC